jgi:hypothetical protein
MMHHRCCVFRQARRKPILQWHFGARRLRKAERNAGGEGPEGGSRTIRPRSGDSGAATYSPANMVALANVTLAGLFSLDMLRR